MGRLFSAGTGPSCNCPISNGAALDRTPPFLRRRKEKGEGRDQRGRSKDDGRRTRKRPVLLTGTLSKWR
jgi:hypothetical protein